jgi:TP53 regulating kinase-like protein
MACPAVKHVCEESYLQEVRSILRARKLGVPTPVLYYVEHETNCIYMEKVEGVSLKALLQSKQLDEQSEHSV